MGSLVEEGGSTSSLVEGGSTCICTVYGISDGLDCS